jgi:hypothetical protein
MQRQSQYALQQLNQDLLQQALDGMNQNMNM